MDKSDVISKFNELKQLLREVVEESKDAGLVVVINGSTVLDVDEIPWHVHPTLHEISWYGSHCTIRGMEDFTVGDEVA